MQLVGCIRACSVPLRLWVDGVRLCAGKGTSQVQRSTLNMAETDHDVEAHALQGQVVFLAEMALVSQHCRTMLQSGDALGD